jgi:hypothetical protein
VPAVLAGAREWITRYFRLKVYYSCNQFPTNIAMIIRAGATIHGGSDEYAGWRHDCMLCVLPQTAADLEWGIAGLAFPRRAILLRRILC